ncbi:unnamed protein product [Dibothriocephalus latus]|uniref:Reverse transcriptase domain-containing protein n=1 Tax=Dibothriocephalus latus TaxID=60516 RepID=A0A3P7Q605_DIBLA|nr:unnamed protein product [Dibothriocephalus latus]
MARQYPDSLPRRLLVFRHHRPKFWAMYVDDTFVLMERDQVLTFEERLNTVFLDIQCTMEEEEKNQLAFLDALVCRKDGGDLKTKVFRKATNAIQWSKSWVYSDHYNHRAKSQVGRKKAEVTRRSGLLCTEISIAVSGGSGHWRSQG